VNFEPLPVEPSPGVPPAGSGNDASMTSDKPLDSAMPADQNAEEKSAPAAQTEGSEQNLASAAVIQFFILKMILKDGGK
jgi:hypothetical protein